MILFLSFCYVLVKYEVKAFWREIKGGRLNGLIVIKGRKAYVSVKGPKHVKGPNDRELYEKAMWPYQSIINIYIYIYLFIYIIF